MQAKPRVLFAWEMGANFGHANKLARIAEYIANDTDVIIAARDPIAVRRMAPDLKATLLPAPFAPTRALAEQEIAGVNYAAVLGMVGWDSATGLAALIEAWQSLLDLVRPDVLVTQASPTAMLAARGRKIKTAVLGSSYDTPPLLTPMPPFALNEPGIQALSIEQENHTTGIANAALALRNLPTGDNFAELVRPDLTLLVTWPELDSYADVRAEAGHPAPIYHGQTVSDGVGIDVSGWVEDGRPRIFAYITAGRPEAAAAMAALNRLAKTHQTILVAPGIIQKDTERLVESGVRVFNQPVRLDKILPGCDLGISHGSNGVASAYIKYNVPQVSLPTQREQQLCAMCLGRAGVGLGLSGKYGAEQVVNLIHKVLATASFKSQSGKLSARIGRNYPTNPAQSAGQEILTLVNIVSANSR